MRLRKTTTSKKRPLITLLIIVFLILTSVNAGYAYIQNYYHADNYANEELVSDANVTVISNKEQIIFAPEAPSYGLIFYPGGKVEYTAYAPLMHTLAQNGFLCILLHMPGNLAVLDVNAADGIQSSFASEYPTVQSWYMAGHSLGGSMAASYLKDHSTDFDGLILLAAYSTTDLSQTNLQVLSIYGSEDGVLNMEKYEKNKKNLPLNYEEQMIDGGCHAYFGSYGFQKGDGTPTITNKEQIQSTADFILTSIKSFSYNQR